MNLALFDCERYHKETRELLNWFEIENAQADFNGLNRILQAFQSIPYENVSKLIRYRKWRGDEQAMIRLPDTIWQEFCENHLGGTCWSLTFFLETILTNRGFDCYPISADMKWGDNVHCGIVVIIDQEHWLCDPGYLLMTPILLSDKMQQMFRTESSGVKLIYDGKKYRLATFHGREVKWRYSFCDIPCRRDEFVKHWLASFEQPTMNGICLTRQQAQGMIYINNNYFREVTRDKIRKNRLAGNWIREIEKIFGIPEIFLEEAYSITKSKGES